MRRCVFSEMSLLKYTSSRRCGMVIEYSPHAAQMEIHRARGFRFRTVCTGRRFGKTLCMAAELLDRGGGDPLSPVGGVSW